MTYAKCKLATRYSSSSKWHVLYLLSRGQFCVSPIYRKR